MQIIGAAAILLIRYSCGNSIWLNSCTNAFSVFKMQCVSCCIYDLCDLTYCCWCCCCEALVLLVASCKFVGPASCHPLLRWPFFRATKNTLFAKVDLQIHFGQHQQPTRPRRNFAHSSSYFRNKTGFYSVRVA